jgi:CRP-like cAMP-binding protein
MQSSLHDPQIAHVADPERPISGEGTEIPLAEVPLFRGLSSPQLEWVERLLRYKAFPAGRDIITMGLPGEAAYIILGGTVKLHAEQANGVDVVLGLLGPGEIFGDISLIDGAVRGATAVTQSEATLGWLDRASFQECLQTLSQVFLNYTRILARRQRILEEKVQILASLDAHGRVARQILSFAREYGEEDGDGTIRLTVPLTQTDIAGLTGISRARANQVLVDYKRCGYITVAQNHHISIHDPMALARRCR